MYRYHMTQNYVRTPWLAEHKKLFELREEDHIGRVLYTGGMVIAFPSPRT